MGGKIYIVTKLCAKVKPSFHVSNTYPFGASIKLTVQSAKLRFEIRGFFIITVIITQSFILKNKQTQRGKKLISSVQKKDVIDLRQCCVALKLNPAPCDSYVSR